MRRGWGWVGVRAGPGWDTIPPSSQLSEFLNLRLLFAPGNRTAVSLRNLDGEHLHSPRIDLKPGWLGWRLGDIWGDSGASLPWCSGELSLKPEKEVAATAALIQRVHTKPSPFVSNKPFRAGHGERHEVRDHF